MSRWRLAVFVFGGLVLGGVERIEAGLYPAAPLIRPRGHHTATLLASGKVLVTGGANANSISVLASSEVFDPATGTWTLTGSLIQGRTLHTATLLRSGLVLVVGGRLGDVMGSSIASAELFDPVTGTFAPTENDLSQARHNHTATLLSDGKVFVVGGQVCGESESGCFNTSSPEVYDPSTGAWSKINVPAVLTGVAFHLPGDSSSSDRIVVVSSDEAAQIEIYTYSSVSNTWSLKRVSLSNSPCSGFNVIGRVRTATVLSSSSNLYQVLLVGASNLFGASNLWSLKINLNTDPPSFPECDGATHTFPTFDISLSGATLLPSGRVFILDSIEGNSPGTPVRTYGIYDSSQETWTSITTNIFSRAILGQAAVLLPDGGVLVTGGFDSSNPLDDVEIYVEEPVGKWSSPPSSQLSFFRPMLAVLPSGRVLAVSGAQASIFDEGSGRWTDPTSSPVGSNWPDIQGVVLPSGRLLVTNGSSAWTYSEPDSWVQVDPTKVTHATGFSLTLLKSGKVLLAGGSVNGASAELFDPTAGTWQKTGLLNSARYSHAAVLLSSGRVLVAGGAAADQTANVTSEIYDPETGQWTVSGRLRERRISPSAVLLPSGQVFVVGGHDAATAILLDPPTVRAPEVYDPATGIWNELAPASFLSDSSAPLEAFLLATGDVLVDTATDSDLGGNTFLYSPSTGTWETVDQIGTTKVENQVLLPSGRLLAVGQNAAGSWIFDPVFLDIQGRSVPSVDTSLPALTYGEPLVVSGIGFRGLSEASDGSTQEAAVNFPLVLLRSLDGRTSRFLAPSQPNFSDTEVAFTAADFPLGSLDPGRHLLSVVVAGVASDPVPIDVYCKAQYSNPDKGPTQTTTPFLTCPPDTPICQREATFVAHCIGAEHYQWRKNDLDISGATGATYTSLPITAADIGSSYSVVCRSDCDDVNAPASTSTPLTVIDEVAPKAAVLSPNGGEVWVLSTEGHSNTQTLIWSMSDNGLICKLVVKLLALTTDGRLVQVQPPLDPLYTEDKGAACSFLNQVTTTSFQYTVPTAQPGGQGLLYKIEVDVTDQVTDQAGHTTVAQSTNPFYMVNPATSDSVRTLILSNLPQMNLTSDAASRLTASLSDLANFANAPGVWFDLRGSTVDQHLLDAWGSCQTSTPSTCDAATANALVSAIRGYIGEILQAYPKLRYVVLVGDDRAIPFARVKDGTTGPAEQDYVPANLTDGSTVGSALENHFYLSDDVVVSRSGEPFPPTDGVDPVPGAFLPDLAVGRLVETPDEIIQTITNFIQQNGVLDLTQTPNPNPNPSKVFVTGYDFLLDSAQAIADGWTASLPSGAVDGDLLGAGWNAEDLKAKLANDHRLFFLNGHAAHFAEGVPGTSDIDIEGLSAADIASLPAPGLNGGVVFAVGCHGGLTVPGSADDSPPDHSLDLPQTFLRQGAIAYVANSGFGWGLKDGIGYSERLIQLLSDQMRSGGTIAVGDAVRGAKLSYFLQRLAADSAYDQKVLFQWTLFGLPMYAVKTGIAAKSASSWSLPPRKEVPAVEHLGPVTVTRRPAAPTANSTPPPFLTQLDLAFDFSGGSVYKKHNAAGNDVTDLGCPQSANGCYYTLNGLSTGAAGLPILPYFVYDSRLSGTSQHGVLWLGGSYLEETGWKPVVAQLISNSGAQTSGGSLPYPLQPHPVSQGRPQPTGATACPASDLDPQSLVVVTGEIASMGTRHRRFDHFNAEILYYNNNDSRENCQQEGPSIAAPAQPYHQLNGSTVAWSVPVTAAEGDEVWRVLVLYDLGPDSQGRGAWAPLELAPDGSGNWTGSLTLPAGRGLSYLIEAVSTHGNVGWLASGIEGVSIPTPTAVGAPPTPTITSPGTTDTFGVGDTIILQGSAVDSLGGALPDSALSWTVLLHQGSQVQAVFGPVSGTSVSFTAPPPASLAAAVDGYLEIQLKATDAMGQSNTVSQRLDPARVVMTFATQPTGLTLTINGAAMVAPQSVTSWRGYPIDLAAYTQSGAGGQRYAFQSWSDGGDWTHTLVTPAAPATDTAVFLLSQTTGPLSFFTVLPCRVIDTRLPLGPMGSPSLSAGQVRYFTLSGVCKVPQTALAVAVNVTIVNPTGTGYLTIHPADQPAATTSVLNFTPGMVRANNAILGLGETGTFAVTFVGSPGTVDFVVDLVGFFE